MILSFAHNTLILLISVVSETIRSVFKNKMFTLSVKMEDLIEDLNQLIFVCAKSFTSSNNKIAWMRNESQQYF